MAAVLTCTASIRGGDIWYWLSVSRRRQALQHGTGSIIADCVGLVSWAAERDNRRKRPCKALCAVLCRGRYNCMDDTKRAVNACIWLYYSKAK